MWAEGGTSLSFDAWEGCEGSRNVHMTQETRATGALGVPAITAFCPHSP